MCVLKALRVRFVYFHPLYGRDILNFGSAVRSSGCHNVCLSGLSLSKSLNLFNLHLTLSQVCLRPILGLKALLLRCFVVQTEPKILRLVFLFCLHFTIFWISGHRQCHTPRQSGCTASRPRSSPSRTENRYFPWDYCLLVYPTHIYRGALLSRLLGCLNNGQLSIRKSGEGRDLVIEMFSLFYWF